MDAGGLTPVATRVGIVRTRGAVLAGGAPEITVGKREESTHKKGQFQLTKMSRSGLLPAGRNAARAELCARPCMSNGLFGVGFFIAAVGRNTSV